MPQTEPITQEEWLAKGKALFGDDATLWKFVCPACGNIQTPAEFKALGVDPHKAYRECIGRHLKGSATSLGATRGRNSMPTKNGRHSPCDYAIYGLLMLSKAAPVISPDHGKEVYVFEFAEGRQADAAD